MAEADSNSIVSNEQPVEDIISDHPDDFTITKTIIDFNDEDSRYDYQTIFTSSQGWGYQLLDSGKVFINQPHIPAVSGNEGFSSEEKAITCAEFALTKVHLGMIPPTLTKDELDSLGVLN
ncbi:MAG: hypothetical protein ACI857_001400 [Arenicella sp.]|jgi:hypothetical protein